MDSTSTAAILLLDLPDKALGGINLLSFTTTPKFKGIKNLPSGFHFVFTGTTSTLSVRHGAWLNITSNNTTSPPDLVIKKWDAVSEALLPVTETADLLHWRANLGSIWTEALTPYRQSAATSSSSSSSSSPEAENNDWTLLTSHVSSALLSRILGTDPNHWSLTSASSAKVDIDDIPGISASEGRTADERELFFLPIDLKRTWRDGATGRERTDAAQDRSWYLSSLAIRHCGNGDWDEVLGELEFCFLMVLTLNNYSCLEQWRRLLGLVFTCRKAVVERPGFFVAFIAALRLQLRHCEDADGGSGGGLFDLSDEGATFLKPLIVKFKKVLEELPGGEKQDVLDELEDLEDYLRETHGWRFQPQGQFTRNGFVTLEDGEQVEMVDDAYDEEDESGDYAPQVVDLSAEQLKELGFGTGDKSYPLRLGKSLKDTLRDDDAEDEEVEEVGLLEDEEDDRDLDELDARY